MHVRLLVCFRNCFPRENIKCVSLYDSYIVIGLYLYKIEGNNITSKSDGYLYVLTQPKDEGLRLQISSFQRPISRLRPLTMTLLSESLNIGLSVQLWHDLRSLQICLASSTTLLLKSLQIYLASSTILLLRLLQSLDLSTFQYDPTLEVTLAEFSQCPDVRVIKNLIILTTAQIFFKALLSPYSTRDTGQYWARNCPIKMQS